MSKTRIIILALSVAFMFESSAIADIDFMQMAPQLNPILYMKMQDKSESEKLEQLASFEQELKDGLAANPDSPEIYWLLGLHAVCKLYAWDDPVPLDKNREQKKIAGSAFRRSLELDDPQNPILGIDMLYSIKKFAPSDVHVEAARRILEEDTNLEPRDELEIRGGMAVHYVSLARYDEALQVFDEFEAKYPGEFTSDLKFKRNYYHKKIAEAKKAELVEKEDKSEPLNSEENVTTAKKPTIPLQKSPQKLPESISEPKPQQSDKNKATLISPKLVMGIVIITAVILGIFIYLRRKKR